MRDGLRWGGRFIPDDIVGVHTLSLLASSRVAHDHATDDYTQHNTQTKTLRTLTYGGSEPGSNLDREVLNLSPCG